MAIGSTNYAQPVQVNGFLCRNCTDVDNAKKHIDPAHPRSGPYGVNAESDPSNPKRFVQGGGRSDEQAAGAATAVQAIGQRVDILA
ncbi:hypothetical protein [Dongia sedimenti]|uniref:Uncharacterized protein n=1 Tax=Dongia sedimenti TaxID=3064282 RepID=A0ABU0YIB2_9PROT|nr:hypothetical protein [Rhodospirillaceae bacterium R-7]